MFQQCRRCCTLFEQKIVEFSNILFFIEFGHIVFVIVRNILTAEML